MTYLIYSDEFGEWFEHKIEEVGNDTIHYVNGRFMDKWIDTKYTRNQFESIIRNNWASKFKMVN